MYLRIRSWDNDLVNQKEKGNTMKYTSIQDVIDYEVVPALGEFADEYDVEEIAHELFEYVDGYFERRYDVSFWEVAQAHDLTAAE